MALSLQQVTDKGVGATYHRISDIKLNFTKEKITVRVASYAGDTYRDDEKNYNADLVELASMRAELDELVQNANEDNADQRQELSDAINNHPLAYTASDAPKDLRVFEKEYVLDLPENEAYDRETVYNLLKTLPEFENATDC